MPPRRKAATTKAAPTTTKKLTTASKTEAKQQTSKRAHSPHSDAQEEIDTPDEGDGRPQKRAKNAATPIEPESTPEPEAPIPSGKIDLYGMELPFLAKFDALYDKILTYQAKPDSTARCVIPDAPFIRQGRLSSAIFEDPMEEMPWDIALDDLRLADPLVFTPAERSKFASPEPQSNCGPGIQGRTVLVEDHCGVASAEGVFRMHRVWIGERGGKAVELWEGYLSFDVVHSGLYKRKGHGSGRKLGIAFWGVRGRRDENGKEIGLDLE
ncbi:hypothetical protein B0H14DRAFT_3899885 [Mycena olivaceomarginata]|nr:hypothetical protein B0H14DRAFT_3899885 [Mycena olivaceomarginata]